MIAEHIHDFTVIAGDGDDVHMAMGNSHYTIVTDMGWHSLIKQGVGNS